MLPVNVQAARQKKLVTRGLSCAVFIAMFALVSRDCVWAKPENRDKKGETVKAAELNPVLWRDPGDVASLDVIDGAGGKDHAPDPGGVFTFEKEDREGTNPKFDVKDEKGIHWKVKLGKEAQAETAATRLMWVAGYFVDEDYYLPQIKVQGLPRLHRGRQFVSSGGIVRNVRLERKIGKQKKVSNWSWFDSPFAGTRELNGLRVMMSLINNWDLKTINNSVYAVGGTQQYVVSDPGASFGKTGNSVSRSKSDLKDYQKSKFIQKEREEDVDFTMHSRPLFITAINVRNYETRTRMEKVTKHIPRKDAQWLGEVLGRLSEEQVRDCFRAAGYGPSEVEGYTHEVLKRVSELKAL